MDAMPLTFEQEFGAWSAQLASAQERIEDSLKRVRRLPLGGTAIGTGINADPRFGAQVAKALKQQTGSSSTAPRTSSKAWPRRTMRWNCPASSMRWPWH